MRFTRVERRARVQRLESSNERQHVELLGRQVALLLEVRGQVVSQRPVRRVETDLGEFRQDMETLAPETGTDVKKKAEDCYYFILIIYIQVV